ncbi:MAG: extracellular solute-binding protein, partial [Treponema sp.]|nr:extracellular solute-binding protein [Treponema sp.]
MFGGCLRRPVHDVSELREPVTFSVNYATGDFLTTSLKHSILAEFQRLNPHITIVERLTPNLRILSAVGEFPDLLEFRHSTDFFETGKIGEMPADIVEMFAITRNFNDRVYAIPMTRGYTIGIVYSKRIFRELGINSSDIKTWNDFLDVCQKIKDAGITPLAAGFADIWHWGFWWNYFWQREISLNNPNWISYRHEGKVSFTDPEVRAVLTGFQELFARGFFIENWNSISEAQCPGILVSGQAAMYYIGQFVFQQIAELDPEFEFGFFALPDNYGRINIIGGLGDTGWAISAEAQKDPARAEAIYDFIRFFFSREVYSDFLNRTNTMSSLKEKFDYPVSEQFRKVLRIV